MPILEAIMARSKVRSRHILEAGNSTDNRPADVPKGSHVQSRHPALPIRFLDDSFDAFEAFARQRRASHRRLLGLKRATLQIFNAKGSEKTLGRLE
jgi:hypothetical protein